MIPVKLKNLTIVTITYNNNGLSKTLQSILPLINAGSTHIIQNGGKHIYNVPQHPNLHIYNEQDKGIYSALNLGIKKVTTSYFMLIHAGDEFIGKISELEQILTDLEQNQISISLNSQYIGNRKHSSRFWRPWMLSFGVQPPHLPCVYATKYFQNKGYNEAIPIIADFDYFQSSCDWSNFMNQHYLLIQMEAGGHTSGGINSFFSTSFEFIRTYKFKGVFYSIARIPFKLIQLF